MSSTLRIRHIWKGLVVTRLFNSWTRSYLVNSVVKRCRRDRGVREVIQCFRQAFFRPSRTLVFSVTAAYKSNDEEGPTSGCDNNISDADLQALVTELEGVEELSRRTLYCQGCAKRVIFDKKQPGVRYCACKDAKLPENSFDGWVPYMEAEDVVIWRKEYKPGQGLYAYKVYGRYKDIRAQDFAAVQVDGAYRQAWDDAVAALAVVEREANGQPDQMVLHWEVLWPRLFANRDYVYMRRHKEFDVKSKCLAHKEGIFNPDNNCGPTTDVTQERPSVHSNAKRKSIENELKERKDKMVDKLIDNKMYIIVSRSCIHAKVPETRNAIRVTEYWSHMVIKTVDGPDKAGTEFVLTYYDEPAVGGMPSAVTAFAAARGAPAFLAKMRRAALDYRAWRGRNHQEAPDFTPFGPETVSYEDRRKAVGISEQDMESSTRGPDLDDEYKGEPTRDQGTQTEGGDDGPVDPKRGMMDAQKQTSDPNDILMMVIENKNIAITTTEVATSPEGATKFPEGATKIPEGVSKVSEAKKIVSDKEKKVDGDTLEEDSDRPEEERKGGWYRYLYPFYYFV